MATTLLSMFGNNGEGRTEQESKNPEELKRDLVSLLQKNEFRIVVMIDDLDRLPNEGVRSVFQLVAAIADFPGVNYVLAYDRKNVSSALSTVQGCDGDQYLEKIIQIPIELPQPSLGMLQIILADGLNCITEPSNIKVEESKELDEMRILIGDRLRSVRDINRLINLFEVEWGQVQGKIAPSDLLGMVALRVFVPAAISWMGARKSVLCGSASEMLVFTNETKEKKKAYLEELGSYLGGSASNLNYTINILYALFPHFAKSCGMSFSPVSNAELELNRRIAHPDIFEHYFTGLIELYHFPREEALRLLDSGEVDELIDFLSQSEQSTSSTLLAYIANRSADLSHQRAESVARAVMRCEVKEGESWAESRRSFRTLEICLERLLRGLGKDSAGALLSEETHDMEFFQLVNLARLIFGQEIAFGRLTEKSPLPDSQLITFDTLKEVENNFKRAFKVTKPTAGQLTYPNTSLLFDFWRKLDVESFETNVVKGVLSDTVGYLLYCTYRLSEYTDGASRGWTFPEGIPADINIMKLREGLSSVWLNEEYWYLSESFRKRIVALSICIEKFKDECEDSCDIKASESDVELRMQEWEKPGVMLANMD